MRRRSENNVLITPVTCIAETEKACLIEFEDGEELWIPKSQIDDDSEVFERGQEGKLVITEWFANKEAITDRGKIIAR